MSDVVAAELLCAFWKLGAPDARLPLIGGILDKALEECLDRLPEELVERLEFSSTSLGRRSLTLPVILFTAQDAMLIEVDGTSCTTARVTPTRDEARMSVIEVGYSTDEAVAIGRALVEASGVLAAPAFRH